ncbi:MAG TPA: hypothetical protein VIU46_06565 [Gallionellaceae bacterium]
MSQFLGNLPADPGDAVFPAADYFLGIAQRVIASGVNTRVILEGRGEVSLFPGRHEYSAKIPDQAEFFQAPAAQFSTSPLDAAERPQNPRHISELLWQAGFHASQGRMVEGTSKYDVIQFRRWPNLPHLPKTANTARICALLTRHPMTIMLVHRQLGIEKDEVYRVYSAAHSAGISYLVSQNLQAIEGDATKAGPAAAPQERVSLLRSLFSKVAGL